MDREEEGSEELDERQKRVVTLVEELTAGIPADSKARTNEQQAQWLLAQLQDWHRREDKATFSEGYRLAELDDLDLLEEKAGLAGLKLLERLVVERKIPVDRYAFAKQETEARVGWPVYFRPFIDRRLVFLYDEAGGQAVTRAEADAALAQGPAGPAGAASTAA